MRPRLRGPAKCSLPHPDEERVDRGDVRRLGRERRGGAGLLHTTHLHGAVARNAPGRSSSLQTTELRFLKGGAMRTSASVAAVTPDRGLTPSACLGRIRPNSFTSTTDEPLTPTQERAGPALMAQFDTTNWSVVLKAGSGDTTGCREALSAAVRDLLVPRLRLRPPERRERRGRRGPHPGVLRAVPREALPRRRAARAGPVPLVPARLRAQLPPQRARPRAGAEERRRAASPPAARRGGRGPLRARAGGRGDPGGPLREGVGPGRARPRPSGGSRRRASASCGASASPACDPS